MEKRNTIITPWEAFINWFDGVPLSLRKYLAHIFRICTTDDTSRMADRPEAALEGFRHWAVTQDFPLRIAARMFYIRSIFDMVIFHYQEILKGNGAFPPALEKDNIIPISVRQWEDILESWKDLRNREMTDTYIHSWTSWMIQLQLETK